MDDHHAHPQQRGPAIIKKEAMHHHDMNHGEQEGRATEGNMHDKHAGHHTQDFLKRFWICVALTVPVLLLSEMIQRWFGFNLRFRADGYVLLALSSFICVEGRRFLQVW